MPRHPERHRTAAGLTGSAFSRFAVRLQRLRGEIYPLHIGDTWLPPAPGLRMQDLAEADLPSLHRYANPHGEPRLLEALARKVESRNSLPVEGIANVLITTGATGALATASEVTVSPGDEVLVLAPYWPLIRGIVSRTGGVPVEVAALGLAARPDALRAALEAQLTRRTVAVYFSSPGNPTGEVFSEQALSVIADFARANDLWIWADEVYEDYAYEGRHSSIGALAPERTLTAFSFSKAYGMTGHRVGYLVGPAAAMDDARRIVTHIWYSVTTASQELALRALGGGDRWLSDARASYAETGRQAAAILGVPAPQGGTFLFVDTTRALDDRGLDGLLEDCLDENLLVAPGPSFGHDYGSFVRLCFTAARPDVVLRGAEKLARRLQR